MDSPLLEHLLERSKDLESKLDKVIEQLNILGRHDQRLIHLENDQQDTDRRLRDHESDIYGKDGLFHKVTRNSLVTNAVTALGALVISAIVSTTLPQLMSEDDDRNFSKPIASTNRIPQPTDREQWMANHRYWLKRFDIQRWDQFIKEREHG